ncbi:hypothetical protein BDZ89DRAFT_500587 [Hymenopellis radicata]|nr:hypothetical protein BDZ89DRAFT_500587 [Hymenopellis radicata]
MMQIAPTSSALDYVLSATIPVLATLRNIRHAFRDEFSRRMCMRYVWLGIIINISTLSEYSSSFISGISTTVSLRAGAQFNADSYLIFVKSVCSSNSLDARDAFFDHRPFPSYILAEGPHWFDICRLIRSNCNFQTVFYPMDSYFDWIYSVVNHSRGSGKGNQVQRLTRRHHLTVSRPIWDVISLLFDSYVTAFLITP